MSLTEDLMAMGWDCDEPCPHCGAEMDAEFVDAGIGMQQVTPWYCPRCGYNQAQVIYDRLVTLVMRQGNWLSSPEAQLLPTAEWERQFARYQEQLEELRRLGDELRASRSTARPTAESSAPGKSASWRAAAVIYGPPGTKGSVRAYVRPGGRRPVVVNDNRRARHWQQALAAEMRLVRPAHPSRAPIEMRITVLLARPKSHYGTGRNAGVLKPGAPAVPTGKPDLDKIQRCVLDAGTGAWYVDDAQIVSVEARKGWAENGDTRTLVEAWEWTPEGEEGPAGAPQPHAVNALQGALEPVRACAPERRRREPAEG